MDQDRAASAAEEYLTETYKPLATCPVKAVQRGERWEVDAALVKPRGSKYTLERYLLTLNRDGKVTRCVRQQTLLLEPVTR